MSAHGRVTLALLSNVSAINSMNCISSYFVGFHLMHTIIVLLM